MRMAHHYRRLGLRHCRLPHPIPQHLQQPIIPPDALALVSVEIVGLENLLRTTPRGATDREALLYRLATSYGRWECGAQAVCRQSRDSVGKAACWRIRPKVSSDVESRCGASYRPMSAHELMKPTMRRSAWLIA